MKIAFVYFSSTGITPRLATEIAKGFVFEKSTQIDYLRIKKGLKYNLNSYDIIGIGAPAYSFRAPRLATRLLRKIDFHKKPFFVFATYNTMPGNTLWSLYRSVKHTGGICLGYLQGSVTVNIRAWKPKIRTGKQLKGISDVLSKQAKEFGGEILIRYLYCLNNEKEQQNHSWIPPKKILLIFWALLFTWSWEMLLTVGIKHVNTTKCTHCGLCAIKICPSGAIRLSKNNTPRFTEILCVGCNGCVNLCPADAIWTFQTRNRLQYNLYKNYIMDDEI